MRAALLILLLQAASPSSQEPIDPELRSVVERLYATQQAEDAASFLALWSRAAARPDPRMLKQVFDSGDDTFENLEITRATIKGDTARVRLAVTRVRSQTNPAVPDAPPRVFTTRLQIALVFARENGEWKVLREGTPSDEFAEVLTAETDPAVRARLLAENADVVNVRLIEALGRLADSFARKFEYKAAQKIYEVAVEAARAMKDRKAEGQMLQNIANSLYFLRDFAGALTHYEARLAIERDLANDDGIANALVGIATIKYSTFEYTTALRLYREALEIQQRLDDQLLIANTEISIANVLYLQGDFDAAASGYRRAEALKRKYYDLGGAAQALEGLGRTLAAQGDYNGALVALGRLLDESRTRKDRPRQASALLNIGDVHSRLVNLDAARAAFDESRALYEEGKDLAAAGRALQGTGVVELMSGRMPQAEAAYEKSHALCTAAAPQPDKECVARALVGLGFAQASQERWGPSIASYRKGIEAYVQLNAAEAAARAQVGLAEALAGKEEYVAALATATDARHTGVALGADDLLWRALVSQARAQRRLKRAGDALGSARAAVGAVRDMAKAALLRPSSAAPRDSATAFVTAAVLHAEAGDAAAAWSAIEEMRALALRAALAPHEQEIAVGMTAEDRTAERALAGELNPLLTQRDREKTLSPPDEGRLKKLNAAIDAATTKRTTWQQQLFARLPELTVWRGLAPPATADDLAAVLKPGDLWVQFVVDDHDLLVLTASRDRNADQEANVALAAYVVPVKRPALAEMVARTVVPTELADVELWRKASADFVKLIPPAVRDQMTAAATVTILPDDMLWRIPFEALPAGTGYVADSAPVRYAHSLTVTVRAPARHVAASPLRAAFFAAPQLPTALVETLKTTAPTWTLRAPDEAQAEVTRIAAVLEPETTSVSVGPGATEDAFRTAGTSASVLHATGPFRVNAASPLFSPLLLSPPEGADQLDASRNGIVETREVPTAGLAARTLVVSDPAALTMRDSAASVGALQWVWRSGGVDALVIRRWSSDAAATNELLAAFYTALREGRSPLDAMYGAQLALRKATPTLPPAAWAGWVVLGGRQP